MTAQQPEFIESTAGNVSEELARRGVSTERRVLVAIEPDDWLVEVRRVARSHVGAKGWSDAEIDQLIEEEREAVQPDPR